MTSRLARHEVHFYRMSLELVLGVCTSWCADPVIMAHLRTAKASKARQHDSMGGIETKCSSPEADRVELDVLADDDLWSEWVHFALFFEMIIHSLKDRSTIRRHSRRLPRPWLT